MIGAMLEKLSEYFYHPVVFWTAPLVLVVAAAVWRRARGLSGAPPDHGPGDPQQPDDGAV